MTPDHNPPGAAETGGAVELLTCPFCGGKAQYFPRQEALFGTAWIAHTIQCEGCCSRVSATANMETAISLWNTRAADPHITVEDERYARELLDDLKRDDISPVAIAVKWFRKARHECVRAASDTRAPVELLPRQPTEAMLNAARDWSVEKYRRGIGNDAAIGCWQAMYDAFRAPVVSSQAGEREALAGPNYIDEICGPAPGGMELADVSPYEFAAKNSGWILIPDENGGYFERNASDEPERVWLLGNWKKLCEFADISLGADPVFIPPTLAELTKLRARVASFIRDTDPFGDHFSRRDLIILETYEHSAFRTAAQSAVRERTIEECAEILDRAAQDWNKIRDPGMANNARSYAKAIRSLAQTGVMR